MEADKIIGPFLISSTRQIYCFKSFVTFAWEVGASMSTGSSSGNDQETQIVSIVKVGIHTKYYNNI